MQYQSLIANHHDDSRPKARDAQLLAEIKKIPYIKGLLEQQNKQDYRSILKAYLICVIYPALKAQKYGEPSKAFTLISDQFTKWVNRGKVFLKTVEGNIGPRLL